MLSVFRKNLITYKLPPTLKWVENYSLSYSYKRLRRDWHRLFTHHNPKSSLKLYTQSITSKEKVLILPCVLEDLNLYLLVSNLNAQGISCSVLLPNSLFLTKSEISSAHQLLGPDILNFPLSISSNLHSFPSNTLFYNPILSPSSYFKTLSTPKDKDLLLKIRSNYYYLHKQHLDLKSAFATDTRELIPNDVPILSPSPGTVFYETTENPHDFPSITEKSSFLTALREPLLANILKALFK